MLVDQSYTVAELEPFNVSIHPMWVFDVENRSMYWANTAALQEVWNADSLQDLLARDMKSDMTEATRHRLEESLRKCRSGELITEQWTVYPKNKATTMNITGSGIRIEGGRVAVLYEAEIAKNQYEDSTVRGLELLRHLPLPVCQFSIEGKTRYRNPEAIRVYGAVGENDFFSHFVEKKVGEKAFQQVVAGQDCNIEAEHTTRNGDTRWFSLSLRRARDPVSTDNLVLLTARDITEVLQARKEKEATNLKAEFLAILSHDIRTPLSHLVGCMDLLELSEQTPEQKQQVDLAQSSAALLMGITNDLLDYSRLESGKIKIECTCFDLPALIDGCVTAVRQDAEEKGLKLITNFDGHVPMQIRGDPIRLRRVLFNLLENAIKFTTAGYVSLSVSVLGAEKLQFQVSDTGVGLSTASQSIVFEKYRVAPHESVTSSYSGTGLGLAICRGLVEAMGGTIGLHSEVGKGSTFRFHIRFQHPPNKRQRLDGEKPPHVVAVAEEMKPLHVLVVEDNSVNQKVLRRMLERLGHSVSIAEDGQVAVDLLKAKKQKFDLILMDRMMPKLNGIEATIAIRKMGLSKSELPIIGLTASFQHSELEYYRENGMNDCLGKPVKLASLKRAIADVANDHQSKQAPTSNVAHRRISL